MRTISFMLEPELLEDLDSYTIKYGLKRSEVIRKAIERLIREELSKETTPRAKVEKIKL